MTVLGFGSVEIALAYVLCLLATVLCVAYGAANWNAQGEPDRVKVKKIIDPKTD